MSSIVTPLANVPLPQIAEIPGTGGAVPGEFQSMLSHAIGGVEKLRGAADDSVTRFLAGEGGEVHSVALATQRAELAFETFLQVRNKVVSAYQAVMQMQV